MGPNVLCSVAVTPLIQDKRPYNSDNAQPSSCKLKFLILSQIACLVSQKRYYLVLLIFHHEHQYKFLFLLSEFR